MDSDYVLVNNDLQTPNIIDYIKSEINKIELLGNIVTDETIKNILININIKNYNLHEILQKLKNEKQDMFNYHEQQTMIYFHKYY
jgi:hypothetical protein